MYDHKFHDQSFIFIYNGQIIKVHFLIKDFFILAIVSTLQGASERRPLAALVFLIIQFSPFFVDNPPDKTDFMFVSRFSVFHTTIPVLHVQRSVVVNMASGSLFHE